MDRPIARRALSMSCARRGANTERLRTQRSRPARRKLGDSHRRSAGEKLGAAALQRWHARALIPLHLKNLLPPIDPSRPAISGNGHLKIAPYSVVVIDAAGHLE